MARAEELSLQIDHLHVSYLQADESPHKIEQRTKLESKFSASQLCLNIFNLCSKHVHLFSFSCFSRFYQEVFMFGWTWPQIHFSPNCRDPTMQCGNEEQF